MAGVSNGEREAHLRALAERMRFRLEKRGSRFSLMRTVDLPEAERETDLSLDDVQDVLDTWKLRGLGGD